MNDLVNLMILPCSQLKIMIKLHFNQLFQKNYKEIMNLKVRKLILFYYHDLNLDQMLLILLYPKRLQRNHYFIEVEKLFYKFKFL